MVKRKDADSWNRVGMQFLGPFSSRASVKNTLQSSHDVMLALILAERKSRNNTLPRTLMVYVFILTSRDRKSAGSRVKELYLQFENLESTGYPTARVSRKTS